MASTVWTPITAPRQDGAAERPLFLPSVLTQSVLPLGSWQFEASPPNDHTAFHGPGAFDLGMRTVNGAGPTDFTAHLIFDFATPDDDIDFTRLITWRIGLQGDNNGWIKPTFRIKFFDDDIQIGDTITFTLLGQSDRIADTLDPNELIDKTGAGLKLRIECDYRKDFTNFNNGYVFRVEASIPTTARIWTKIAGSPT